MGPHLGTSWHAFGRLWKGFAKFAIVAITRKPGAGCARHGLRAFTPALGARRAAIRSIPALTSSDAAFGKPCKRGLTTGAAVNFCEMGRQLFV
jgi:hypothetical protein